MQINLSWSADGVIDSYNIYKSITPMLVENMPPPLASANDKSYVDFDIEAENQYYYRIESVRLGIKKMSDEVSVNTFSSAKMSFVASNVIGAYSTTSSVNLPIPPHLSGDAIIIVRRGAGTTPTGYTLLFNANGVTVFYKIAASNQSSQTIQVVPITYGGAASIILRPERPISVVETERSAIVYQNSTYNVTTPALSVSVTDYFELDILHWSTVTTGMVTMSNSLNGQTLLASNGTPVQTGQGMNFIVAGMPRSTATPGLAATLGGGAYIANNQTLTALTVAIKAR